MHLTADLVTALDDGAGHALTTEKAAQGNAAQARVTQRELDLGDGSVVHLVGILYRAFHEATAALPTLVVPPLGDLARFFDRPAAKPSPAAPPQPGPGGVTSPAARARSARGRHVDEARHPEALVEGARDAPRRAQPVAALRFHASITGAESMSSG